MQPNNPGQPPRRPLRPVQRGRADTRQATPNVLRNDLPPGMGGGEPSYAPQPYQAQPGAAAHQANTGYQQGPPQHPTYYQPSAPPVQVGSINGKAWGGVGVGALLIIFGIGATMMSYDSPGPDGSYTVWWGPVLFGFITLIGGVAAFFKK
jgi:hypothetical protein